MNTIGPMIRDVRKQLGLTQEDFAGMLGMTVSTVNRWEKGYSKPSKLARCALTRIAGGRGVHVPDAISNPEQAFATPSAPWFDAPRLEACAS